ncbi:Adaptin ear-binding coat-associated protein [Sphaerulina musiva]
MAITDPATGLPLPDSAIQRVLFAHTPVHIYGIPPLTSNAGFSASTWTSPTRPTAQHIFTARLRILETSISSSDQQQQQGKLKCDLVLEDPNTGDLFAAAPYTTPAVVQQANDSSRFFAVRVAGEGGMKATLGMGFEDRSPAFDFGIALTEARKVLGMETQNSGSTGAGRGAQLLQKQREADSKKDFSLKEGEKIVVNVPGRRQRPAADAGHSESSGSDTAALFSIAPPPPAAAAPSSALQMEGQSATPESTVDGKTAQELGFDDGEFGEFQ